MIWLDTPHFKVTGTRKDVKDVHLNEIQHCLQLVQVDTIPLKSLLQGDLKMIQSTQHQLAASETLIEG